jgi:6-phosphogluconolactonase
MLTDTGNGQSTTVLARASTFTVDTGLASGANYSITVAGQPSSPTQSCTITSGASGTDITQNVTSVIVSCTTTQFSISGTISGLTGSGLVLKDSTSGQQTQPLAAGTTSFSITGVNSGTAYSVAVATQPSTPPQLCTVSNGTGNVTTAGVSGVAVHCVKVGQYLYLTNPFDGNTGTIAAFTIDSTSGALTAAPQSPYTSTDSRPYAVAIDPAGQFVYVANFGSASVSTESIVTGGALALDVTTPASTGAGTNQPQSVVLDPAGPYLYIGSNDSPSGTIEAYSITAGTLAPISGTLATSVFPDGNVPTGVAIDSTDSFLYAANVNDGTVAGFSILVSPATPPGGLSATTGSPFGTLTAPFGVATHPSAAFVYVTDFSGNTVTEFTSLLGVLTQGVSYPVGHSPEGIAIDPTGTYLYVSNSADGTVSAFVISPTDGTLTAVTNSPFTAVTGAGVPSINTPTAVAIDPSSQFLYVANGDAGTVTPFTIGTGGALTPIGPSNALTPVPTFVNNEGPSSVAVF